MAQNDRLLTLSDILDATGYRSRTTIWSLVRASRFPVPVRLDRRVRWRESEIRAWIDALPRQTYSQGGRHD